MKLSLTLLAAYTTAIHGFAPAPSNRRAFARAPAFSHLARIGHVRLHATEEDDEEEEEEKKENPYQDPNYPDLEFVDYSDPEYVVDQGVTDEFFSEDDTEEQIEAMREERRRRNDEYQFETYFANVLRKGEEYMGEWTVYKVNNEVLDENGFPRFQKARHTMKVVSKGRKDIIDPNAEWRVDGERIRHEEVAVSEDEGDPEIEWLEGPSDDDDSPAKELSKISSERLKMEQELMANKYWPEEMTAFDMRGQQGNMCVGNAYTICASVPMKGGQEDYEGPFSEMRTEVGIQSEDLRFRVKLNYGIMEGSEEDFPPLNLKTLVVCRETLDMWPRDSKRLLDTAGSSSDTLFGAPGASGGLYDPPPVGCEEQSGRYMMLDLDGGATLLFPYKMDQHPEAFEGNGWVTSLDWTPGRIRYQVDRKVEGGKKLMGLRSLELSEVQGVDADTYRPKDGGKDMRQ